MILKHISYPRTTYAPKTASFVLVVQLEGLFRFCDILGKNIKNYSISWTVCTFSAPGRQLAWQFTKDNWKQFHDRYQGGFLLSRLVKVKMALLAKILQGKHRCSVWRGVKGKEPP